MSYEPTLIIKYDDLKKYKSIFKEEKCSTNMSEKKIAKYLLKKLRFKNSLPVFEVIRIIVTRPKTPHFNYLIRGKLDEIGVEFTEFI